MSQDADDYVDPSMITIRFPCLRARQPVGDLFIASINYKDLAKLTYFDVRRVLKEDRDFEQYLGIQRPLEPRRVKSLEAYVNLVDASFPSSIIISLLEDYVSYDEADGRMTVRNFREGESAPSAAISRVGRVLDGQHRIAGLEAFSGDAFDLSVTIFVGADISDQAQIFSTVNIEQTKVNKSLVYDLYELARSRSPQKTCHNIVVALDRDPQSPFFKRIKRLGLASDDRVFEPVTQSTLVEGLIVYISGNPSSDRDNLLRGRPLERPSVEELYRRPFRNLFIKQQDIEIIQIVYNYFTAAKLRWPKAWDDRSRGLILNRTNGVRALLRFLGVAYMRVASPGSSVPTEVFLEKVFRKVELEDDDFNVENFLPGTSGESRLFRILKGEERL